MRRFFVPLLLVLSGCARVPQNAAPTPVRADVQFVRDMIAHHAQAIEMSALAPSRARSDAVKLLAERIDVSQRDEIARMNRWLAARGERTIEREHAAHTGSHAGMPGMMTPEAMARLRDSTAASFDALFLEMMIQHHDGALVMVERLSTTPGGVQDADLWELASSIDADQRAEIARMRALLSNLQ